MQYEDLNKKSAYWKALQRDIDQQASFIRGLGALQVKNPLEGTLSQLDKYLALHQNIGAKIPDYSKTLRTIGVQIPDHSKLFQTMGAASKLIEVATQCSSATKAMQAFKNQHPFWYNAATMPSKLDYYTNRPYHRFLDSPDAVSIATRRIQDDYSETVTSSGDPQQVEEALAPPDIVEALTLTDLFSDISGRSASDFYGYLMEYPMLPLTHEVGRRVFEGIGKAQTKELKPGTIVYRARRRDNPEIPLAPPQMWEPPFGKAGQGRYNPHGQSVLYTCDIQEATLDEIRDDKEAFIADLAELKVTKHLNFLDLTGDQHQLFKFCRMKASEGMRIEPAYAIPNFIAQCCQYHRIQAISYESIEHPGAIAYVFFGGFRDWFSLCVISEIEGIRVAPVDNAKIS
jgi:hypothetical protein